MSVAHVNSHAHVGSRQGRAAQRGQSKPFARLRVGEKVEVKLVRKLDSSTFLVSLDGGQHVMDSAFPMLVGSRVHAVVVAVGDKLELRYLEGDQSAPEEEETPDPGSSVPAALIASLEARYRLSLSTQDRVALQNSVATATDETSRALGGLYLAKLGVPMTETTLDALEEVQAAKAAVGTARAANASDATDLSALVASAATGETNSVNALAALLGAALPGDSTTVVPDGHPKEDEVASWLLNLQDGGAVAYRYGTLPVIVAGQLVELDLVVLQQRDPAQSSPAVRRLVMSLQTRNFGQVRIEARALDERLVVTFTTQSVQAKDELRTYRDEVQHLVSRLGWNVEAIGYELVARPIAAARDVIDHVLSAGSVDQVL